MELDNIKVEKPPLWTISHQEFPSRQQCTCVKSDNHPLQEGIRQASPSRHAPASIASGSNALAKYIATLSAGCSVHCEGRSGILVALPKQIVLQDSNEEAKEVVCRVA